MWIKDKAYCNQSRKKEQRKCIMRVFYILVVCAIFKCNCSCCLLSACAGWCWLGLLGSLWPCWALRNAPGAVRTGAVQHGGSRAVTGSLKQLWKLRCACTHCDLRRFLNPRAWLSFPGSGRGSLGLPPAKLQLPTPNPETTETNVQIRSIKYEYALWPAILTGLWLLWIMWRPRALHL